MSTAIADLRIALFRVEEEHRAMLAVLRTNVDRGVVPPLTAHFAATRALVKRIDTAQAMDFDAAQARVEMQVDA